MQVSGLHHLTAITADAPGNHRFYTQVLGLRLVKRTVNQDDVSAYHLFYADGVGSPGTDITFFDWPAAPERRGSGSIARTRFRVPNEASLRWWAAHLHRHGVRASELTVMDNRLTLDFEDAEGQRLGLVDDSGGAPGVTWNASPVPANHQIRGLGPVLISVADRARTERALTGVLGMVHAREYHAADGASVHVYRMGGQGPGAELHVAVQPDLPRAQEGAGGVHHVAFTIPDADYGIWAERLQHFGVRNSGPVDRYYFRSLYFREPGGILFEIATEGPGFGADEPMDRMGDRLALPPFLESRRAEIERGLKPLNIEERAG